jgi:hypothetical protein
MIRFVIRVEVWDDLPGGSIQGLIIDLAFYGVLKYRKSARANFVRNTCTTDVSDAAPKRCPRELTLRLVLPRLCNANTFIARHNQHIELYSKRSYCRWWTVNWRCDGGTEAALVGRVW